VGTWRNTCLCSSASKQVGRTEVTFASGSGASRPCSWLRWQHFSFDCSERRNGPQGCVWDGMVPTGARRACTHKSAFCKRNLVLSALPQKRTSEPLPRYIRLVPCVDGSELARTFFTSQTWSVQPCVRPVCAVRMTAGHNALRGSGPGQKPAFEMQRH